VLARRRLPSDDALHAQGAAAALEDAAVLARCLEPRAGGSCEQAAQASTKQRRKPAHLAIQAKSSANTWMRTDADPGRVYG